MVKGGRDHPGRCMFGFERLDAWHVSTKYAHDIYLATRPFPTEERYGLTNQLRRAAVSISANLAEGSGRTSPKDFSRFVEIAFGSLMETVSHLKIAVDQGFLDADEYRNLYASAEQLAKMLSGLRNHLARDQS